MDRIGAAGPKSVAVVLGLRAGGVVLDLPAGAGNSAVLVRQVVQCSAIDPWMQRAVNGAPWPTTIRPIRPLRRIGDQAMRNHSTQYVSTPGYGWKKLREEHPWVYESYADLEPGKWTHLKIVVVSMICATLIAGIGVANRLTDKPGSAGEVTVVKAAKPVTAAVGENRTIR